MIYINITVASILGVFLFFSSADLSKAQTSPVKWGLTAGVSVADMRGDDVGGTSTKAGFVGGLFLNYRVNSFFSLQPEVLFSMKNSEVNSGILGENVTTDYKFGYLELPVLLKRTRPDRWCNKS